MYIKRAKIQQTQFVVLKSIIYNIDHAEDTKSVSELPIDFDYEFLEHKEIKTKIRVILSIRINQDKAKDGYFIDVQTGSEYEISEDISRTDKEYQGLLLYSALPCLINQTRLFLKTVTSHFPTKEYILPMIDMLDLVKQKVGNFEAKGIKKREYRKLKTGKTWHWRKDCSRYPHANYITSFSKPTTGKLCKVCELKNI